MTETSQFPAAAPSHSAHAWHYDGASATRHAVGVLPTADGLILARDGATYGPYAWSMITALDGGQGKSVYGLKGAHGWRLIFDGAPPHAIAIHLPLPARYGHWIDRVGLTRAAIVFAGIAAVVVFATVKAPGWIAPFVPLSVENQLGDAMVGDFGGRFCRTPAGNAALNQLSRTLGGPAAHVRHVEVANIPIVNAVTLPGGRIIIFRELLEQADSADEVAGILGHEIGHARHRDGMTALIRQLGLSVVLGGFSGDVGGALNGLLDLRYSRAAESAADDYAIDALRHGDIAPDGTATFFRRLSKREGKSISAASSWMDSHPISADRERAFRRSHISGKAYRPALDDKQWQALRTICAQDKRVAPAMQFNW